MATEFRQNIITVFENCTMSTKNIYSVKIFKA